MDHAQPSVVILESDGGLEVSLHLQSVAPGFSIMVVQAVADNLHLATDSVTMAVHLLALHAPVQIVTRVLAVMQVSGI